MASTVVQTGITKVVTQQQDWRLKMTTTENRVATVVAEVNAAELFRVISDVVPHVGTDETLPPINQMHVEISSTQLVAVGTDRYTLGVSRVQLDGTTKGGVCHSEDGAAFNLALNDVVSLVKMAKTAKRDSDRRLCTITQLYHDSAIEFAFNSGETLTLKGTDQSFPVHWRKMFPDSATEVKRSALGFTAPYLARFAKVVSATGTMALFTFDDGNHRRTEESVGHVEQKRPFVVKIGDNFVGLIMPVRLGDAGQHVWEKPDWL